MGISRPSDLRPPPAITSYHKKVTSISFRRRKVAGVGLARASTLALIVRMADEMAMRLLQATREQLHGKPTREVEPFEIAQKAAINPFSPEYDTAIRYLLDHGYIEHYPNEAVTALGLYKVTTKDWKRFLATPNRPP